MKESKCRYCGKQFSNRMQVGGHQTFCPFNPKYTENKTKVRNTKDSNNPILSYVIVCSKCGKEFKLQLHKSTYQSGRYRKHCSRACANSRTWTEQDKAKISSGMETAASNLITAVCLNCKGQYKKSAVAYSRKYCQVCYNSIDTRKCTRCQKQFTVKRLSKRTKCLSCSQDKELKSRVGKLSYKQGRKKVQGGTTQWIEVETSNGVIKVQGTYQERMCKVLDKMKEVGNIKDWSYSPDRIQYIAEDNEKHIYIPDFKVFYKDGVFKYIETKGWLKQRDRYKLNGVLSLGYQIQMLFQKDIKSYEQKYM